MPAGATDAKTLTDLLLNTVVAGASVYSDEYASYSQLSQHFDHEVIRHSAGEYVRENLIHTNSIESFWALFRRGHYGTYHQMSEKHLHRYLNEFAGRQNARGRSMLNQMAALVKAMEGRRLTYKELIQE